MAVIGEFTTNGNNSIAGFVRTLTVSFKARLSPIERVSLELPFSSLDGIDEASVLPSSLGFSHEPRLHLPPLP